MIDCGRYAAKRTVGDELTVGADIFRDGHDVLRAVVRYCAPGAHRWREAEMHRIDAHLDGDRWEGSFEVDRTGRWLWTIEAWTDAFATWRGEFERKIGAGQRDLSGELSEGVVLLEQAAQRAKKGPDHTLIARAMKVLTDPAKPDAVKCEAALDTRLLEAVERHPDRSDTTTLEQRLVVDVDRERARFGTWYELFPRSWGGLNGVATQVPELAELGFDVLYLPPVHPIGHTNRKGTNNALVAATGDPGSPWAIGDESGGH
ncbi:MAG: DUF3416 domain-containing protein, partial [Actinomycetota bacterium]|nr:DUF3416 domain-containing protein [Actinomycetota bacterium]